MGLILAMVFGFIVAFVIQTTLRLAWLALVVPVAAFVAVLLFDVYLVQGPNSAVSSWPAGLVFGLPLILAGACGGLYVAHRKQKMRRVNEP